LGVCTNVKKLFDLSGKVALIIGGSRGLDLIAEGARDSLAERPLRERRRLRQVNGSKPTYLTEQHMKVAKLFDLSGKVALITGGSRGLGLQIAEALGEMGAKVVITAQGRRVEEAKAHLKAWASTRLEGQRPAEHRFGQTDDRAGAEGPDRRSIPGEWSW
jgi:hypothetical protein